MGCSFTQDHMMRLMFTITHKNYYVTKVHYLYSIERNYVDDASFVMMQYAITTIYTLLSTNCEGHFCAVYSYHYTACIECTDYSYKN